MYIILMSIGSIEGQRKLSLRFLSGCILGENIQGETHDSIEDAKMALKLYETYSTLLAEGGKESIVSILREMYAYGRRHDWKYNPREPLLLAIHDSKGIEGAK